MNPSAAIPFTQMIVSWTLLGVLLAWMFFFAFLALRSLRIEKREMADLPTPSGAFPALAPQTQLHPPSPTTDITRGTLAEASHESAREVGTVPVA